MVRCITIVFNIKAVHNMALGVTSEPELVLQFLVAVTDVNSLWNQFKLEDDAVQYCLVQFNKTDDFLVELLADIRGLTIKYNVFGVSGCPVHCIKH